MTLGIINAGLGLQLSGNTTKGEIAYGVIAGVIWLVWVAVAVMSHVSTRGTRGETGEKISRKEIAGEFNGDGNGVMNRSA